MANETSGRRDNRVPFRASTKTPNIMMLRRTRFLLIVCGILAFAVLGIKLFNVMIVHHDEYEKMAIDQQVRETEITASRGAIYDTNGKILAMNASVDTIFISPAEIAKNKEDPQLIARELSEILDVDYNKILAMTKNTDRWYEVVKRKVEPDVSEKVRAFKKENKLIGVKIEPDTKRYYPYGSLAAHVIGFVGQDNEGRYGLEQRYDSYLTGSTGRIIRATDNRGTDMLFVNYEDYHDETKGNDMNLTIDATIQYYLEKHLQQAVEDYDVQNGAAAIAMDPNSGAILGMVSLGNFDLNNYQKVSDKDKEAIDAETDPDKKAELLSAAQTKQWRNKALSDTYEPGSTFKIITLAMALEEGVVNENSSFYCGGSTNVLGRTDPLKCWKTTGHGSQNLTQAIQHSCNVALVQIGQLVGARTFYKYAEAFGFLNLTSNVDSNLTAKTGIDMSGESGSIWWSQNTFYDPENLSQLAAASFGRGAPGRERADERHRAPDPRTGRRRPHRRHRQERLRRRLPHRRQDRHVGKGCAGRGRRREGVHRLVHRLRPGGRPADRHPRAARHAEQQHRHLHQRRPDGRAHRRQNDGGHPAVPRRGAVVFRDGKDAHG